MNVDDMDYIQHRINMEEVGRIATNNAVVDRIHRKFSDTQPTYPEGALVTQEEYDALCIQLVDLNVKILEQEGVIREQNELLSNNAWAKTANVAQPAVVWK